MVVNIHKTQVIHEQVPDRHQYIDIYIYIYIYIKHLRVFFFNYKFWPTEHKPLNKQIGFFIRIKLHEPISTKLGRKYL